MPTNTKSLTAEILNPTTALNGNPRRPTVFRGANMVLRGPSDDPYFEAYPGDLDLNENYDLDTYGKITGSIDCANGSTAVVGTATVFLSELHIGQMLLAGTEVFVVKEIISDTSFTADRPATAAVSSKSAYRLPQLFEINRKRGVLYTGNAIEFLAGHIIGVGSGELRINGAALAGTSMTATSRPQIALYRPATNDYVVLPLGYGGAPPKPTIDVVTGGVKAMTDGDKHSFMFSYWSGSPEGSDGYGNPTDAIKLDSVAAVLKISGTNNRFRIDFTASIVGMPSNAKGFVIWGNQGGRKTVSIQGATTTTTSPNDTLYENGPWYRVAKVKTASQTFVAADVNTGTDIITLTNHPFSTGDQVFLSSSGTAISLTALGSPIVNTTPAWVYRIDKDSIKLCATKDKALVGTADDITGAGTGTHTIQYLSQGKYYYLEYLDSDIYEEVTGNNDKPPFCEYVAKIEGKPMYVSAYGKRTNEATKGSNPGPYVVVSKFSNPDAAPTEWSASTVTGDILGWFEGVGRWFLMTASSLEFVVSTGLFGQSLQGGDSLEVPIISRPYWKTGAANRYSIMLVDDTLYGRSGGKFFQSVGNGDENVQKYDFGIFVDDIVRDWYDGHVLSGNDSRNAQIAFIYSASHKNTNGYWCSTILPFSIARKAWLPKIILSKTDRDMIISGVATVDEKLEFLAGGRVSGGTFQTRTYRFAAGESGLTSMPYYLVWQPSDDGAESTSKQIHSFRPSGKFKSMKVQIHGATPGNVISVANMEDGTSALGEVSFADSTAVTRYLRSKCRFKNLATYALRLSGTWDGNNIKDRLEELVVEISAHGRER